MSIAIKKLSAVAHRWQMGDISSDDAMRRVSGLVPEIKARSKSSADAEREASIGYADEVERLRAAHHQIIQAAQFGLTGSNKCTVTENLKSNALWAVLRASWGVLDVAPTTRDEPVVSPGVETEDAE